MSDKKEVVSYNIPIETKDWLRIEAAKRGMRSASELASQVLTAFKNVCEAADGVE
jgi:hypothetical protein